MMVKEPISNLKEGQYEENKTIQLTSKTIGGNDLLYEGWKHAK